ncbi:Thioredoxin domain-containing protein [Habropoda laboriosa]|uniref:Thioredoxin domain-containing protein n=1 Tax=Habropoda laboriosa TaxID=597456 RepID=A0A0L7RHG7_9HYME|nr:PREDICTED: thioredoxin domain-containing protein [Habropoda laboriosa]KOC70315.1 Thioredoxin domain-containing protein [Habropoda laboriosa]
MLRIIFFMFICGFAGVHSASLETVSDEELINLIKTEKYVVVLFTNKDCEACDNYENEMIHLREDLVNSLSAWVIKAVDSQLLRLYSANKEPALVFFRHGMPLLYDGPLNDEEIFIMFTENKEPTVKELTDDTFEHLTQASSGAAAGDWFVMFYSTDCVECVRMIARWEAVGAKLKQKLNVARIDKYTTGASTARRFNVFDAPAFIFFRHGKMYRYQIPKYDINSFVSFAKEWYRNARAEIVPVPQSPFDDLVQMIANFLRENPWVMKLGSMTIGVFIIISVASKFRRKTEVALKKD